MKLHTHDRNRLLGSFRATEHSHTHTHIHTHTHTRTHTNTHTHTHTHTHTCHRLNIMMSNIQSDIHSKEQAMVDLASAMFTKLDMLQYTVPILTHIFSLS